MKKKLSFILLTSLLTTSLSGISVYADTSDIVEFHQNLESTTRISGKVTSVSENIITIETFNIEEETSEIIEVTLDEGTVINNQEHHPNSPKYPESSSVEFSENERPELPEYVEGEHPEPSEGKQPVSPKYPSELPEYTEGEQPELPEYVEGEHPEPSEGKQPGQLSISDITVGSFVEIIYNEDGSILEIRLQTPKPQPVEEYIEETKETVED